VTFQKDRGAPAECTLDALIPLNKHSDPGVKYFSGTATYSSEFHVSELKSPVILDLGTVHGIAEVTINGKPVANLWCPPYRVKLDSGILKPGKNQIGIAVTGSWRNRMIGDEQYPRDFKTVTRNGLEFINEWPEWYIKGEPRPVTERVSFCTSLFYKKADPLQPSGLEGPVMLVNDGMDSPSTSAK
jgi:hypothetical protein